jgi:hypothetical protein
MHLSMCVYVYVNVPFCTAIVCLKDSCRLSVFFINKECGGRFRPKPRLNSREVLRKRQQPGSHRDMHTGGERERDETSCAVSYL